MLLRRTAEEVPPRCVSHRPENGALMNQLSTYTRERGDFVCVTLQKVKQCCHMSLVNVNIVELDLFKEALVRFFLGINSLRRNIFGNTDVKWVFHFY